MRCCNHLDGDKETDPRFELFKDGTLGEDVMGDHLTEMQKRAERVIEE